MSYRLVETEDRVETGDNGVLGWRLTRRGAEKLRRDYPAPTIPATPLDMPMYRLEVEKVNGGLTWDRWAVVAYQNVLVEFD